MNGSSFVVLARCVALVSAVALFAAACDDGPDAAPAPADTGPADIPTFEAFAQRAATQYCERRVVPCCSGKDSIDQATCEAELKQEITQEIGGEGGTYSAEGGARCLSAIGTLSCGSDDDALDRSCRDIMRSQDYHRKQGGETCALESDCAAPIEGAATCDHGCDPGDASCTVGYCVAYVVVGVGATCESDGKKATLVHRCGRDAACVGGVCKGFPGAGEPCPTGSCLEGLRCTPAGRCEAFVAPGKPCTSPAECEAGICEESTMTCPVLSDCH